MANQGLERTAIRLGSTFAWLTPFSFERSPFPVVVAQLVLVRCYASSLPLLPSPYFTAQRRSPIGFVARRPAGRFEVVFDQMAMPLLIIREVGTNRLVDLSRVFPSRFIFVRGYKRSTQGMVGK